MTRTAVLATGALGLLLAGGLWWLGGGRADPQLEEQVERELWRARTWLAQRRLSEAEAAARQVLTLVPDHPQALLIAGEVAMRQERFAEAEQLLSAVRPTASLSYQQALFALGEVARVTGRMSAAESRFRKLLELDPAHGHAHRQLAEVLNLAGRRRDALPHLLATLAQTPQPTTDLLTAVADVERLIHNPEYLQFCRTAAPQDPLPRLAQARVWISERRWSEAREWLEQLVQEEPLLLEAQVQLGIVLHEVGDEAEFLAWHARLPTAVENHPDLWALRGSWQREQGASEVALRCYWEAVRRDRDHRVAVYQLAQLCEVTGRYEAAAVLASRAARLQELTDRIEEIRLAPTDWKRIAEAARLSRELGRWWEAQGWARLAAQAGIQSGWVAETLEQARDRLQQATSLPLSRTVELDADWQNLDLRGIPLPNWPDAPPASPAPLPSGSPSSILFADVAPAVGLEFQYFNAHDPTTEGMRMFEFTGGGVGVIDFDRDGWTDLYFTQGCRWPPLPEQHDHLDALFRNLAGRRFQPWTVLAAIREAGYSQGVSVGDFDCDGFPDLYVANIGRNTLWLNQGDGTFVEIGAQAGLTDSAWTTSCCLADLDQDGLADLYDVNYLQGEGVFTRICQRDGHSRACMPTVFDPAADAVWQNTGDGRVVPALQRWQWDLIPRTGLGVVVADLDASGAVDVFVANDAMANSYYPDVAAAVRAQRALRDQAVLAGLAFDRDGRAQACMGVACGDADGDGQPDLFVTNYYDESNTLYHQQSAGLFVDETARAGLRMPSFKLLGFGTQFLDADLDGWEDLVLVNGHVDDFTHEGVPYRMRPQFFHNRMGRFTELFAGDIGEWFSQEQLGRGLATLDWNRDGRTDFAVSHLDTPAALVSALESATAPGHFVTLVLVGTQAHRDAIGAVVRCRVGDRLLVRPLSGGDGYQASNERAIRLGLGSAERIDTLEVLWPGGRRQQLTGLSGDRHYLVIEGRGVLLLP